MPRPKSDDAKRALTIRFRSSVIERLGGDVKARASIEATVERVLARRDGTETPVKARPASVSVNVPFGGDLVRRPMQKPLKR